RFGGLARVLGPAAGLALIDDRVRDDRSAWLRLRDRLSLARLLARGRLRSILRWPKAILLYSDWASYLAGKLRRARGSGSLAPQQALPRRVAVAADRARQDDRAG